MTEAAQLHDKKTPAKMTRSSANPESAVEQSPPKLHSRSRLFGLDRAAEVAAVFSSADARTVLGRHLHQRRGSKVAWQMILRALDAGLLPEPSGMEASKVTMRFLFPYGSKSYLSRFDLLSTKDRPDIDDMLTRMIACKDALLAQPDQVEAIINNHRRLEQQTKRDQEIEQRVSKAIAVMPPTEHEVIMFGARLWPRTENSQGVYDYRQLEVAIWKFRDLNSWLGDQLSAASRAILIRNSTKWDSHYIAEITNGTEAHIAARRMYQLVHQLANLMERNPNGECKLPPTPVVLG